MDDRMPRWSETDDEASALSPKEKAEIDAFRAVTMKGLDAFLATDRREEDPPWIVETVRKIAEAIKQKAADGEAKTRSDFDAEVHGIAEKARGNLSKFERLQRVAECNKLYVPVIGEIFAGEMPGGVDENRIVSVLKRVYAFVEDGRHYGGWEELPEVLGPRFEKALTINRLKLFLRGGTNVYAMKIPKTPYFLCFVRTDSGVFVFFEDHNVS